MSRRLAPSSVACALLISSAASGQTATSEEDGAHRHRGLFLRLEAGGGYLRSSATVDGLAGSISGPAGSLGVSLGWTLQENLSVFGHVSWSAAPSPTVSLGDSSGSQSLLSFLSGGPGVNYYFMPSNYYASAMVLLTGLFTTSRAGNSGSSEVGLGFKLAVGKEWWVGDRWGLGVAGQFSFGSNQDQGSPSHWKTISPALAFSATFD